MEVQRFVERVANGAGDEFSGFGVFVGVCMKDLGTYKASNADLVGSGSGRNTIGVARGSGKFLEDAGLGFGDEGGGRDGGSGGELLIEEDKNIDRAGLGWGSGDGGGSVFGLVVGTGVASSSAIGADSSGGDGDDFETFVSVFGYGGVVHVGCGSEASAFFRWEAGFRRDSFEVAMRFFDSDYAEVGVCVRGGLAGLVIEKVLEVFAESAVGAAS